ncbi:MAG: DUF502 domain-containing protein [Candidatus Schekmanbacteria bacterium]|nr:DUF502 domain-containing protein [Candidatus Schekmanbacteria bacterium]
MLARVRHTVRNTFLAGILVILPAVITYFVLSFLYGLTTEFVYPALDILGSLLSRQGIELPRFLYPFLAVSGLALLVMATGSMTRNFLGKQIVQAGERLVNRIPVAGSVYSAAKQTLVAFANTDRGAFRRIAVIEYPRPGMYAMAFITCQLGAPPGKDAPGKMLCCFVPTTPNPTSGVLVLVPEADCVFVDITVDEAMRFVVSAGIAAPAGWVNGSFPDLVSLSRRRAAGPARRDVNAYE